MDQMTVWASSTDHERQERVFYLNVRVQSDFTVFKLTNGWITGQKNESPSLHFLMYKPATPPLVRQRNGACCKRDGSTGSKRGRKQRGRCLHLRRMLCSKWRGWRRGGGECSSLLLRQRTSQDRTGPFFASNSRGDFLALKIPVTLKPPSKVRKWIICSDQIILSLRHFFNFHNCVVPKGEWHSGISVYFWHKSRSIFH